MKTLHLLTTTLCDRDCLHCCNKQMDLNKVKYVSDKDFKKCDTVCITGGEPILYSNVVEIARRIKIDYKHIKNIYVYANAYELMQYFADNQKPLFAVIDGVSVSIKNEKDYFAFFYYLHDLYDINLLKSNRLYVFDNLIKKEDVPKGWKYIPRSWQEEFKPAKNCIFRKI